MATCRTDSRWLADRIADAAVIPTRMGHCRIKAPYNPIAGTRGQYVTVEILGSCSTGDLRSVISDLIRSVLEMEASR